MVGDGSLFLYVTSDPVIGTKCKLRVLTSFQCATRPIVQA